MTFRTYFILTSNQLFYRGTFELHLSFYSHLIISIYFLPSPFFSCPVLIFSVFLTDIPLGGYTNTSKSLSIFSVTVGKKPSAAQSFVDDPSAVVEVLNSLVKATQRGRRGLSCNDLNTNSCSSCSSPGNSFSFSGDAIEHHKVSIMRFPLVLLMLKCLEYDRIEEDRRRMLNKTRHFNMCPLLSYHILDYSVFSYVGLVYLPVLSNCHSTLL